MSANATNALELSVDSYCTFGEVQGLVPYLQFTSTDYPTKPQAVRIVREIKADIDAALTVMGYKVPVGSGAATAIRTLGHLNALGAASQIELVARSAAGGSEHATALERRYQAQLKLITTGQIAIIGATMADNYIPRRDQREISYRFNTLDGSEQSPTFTRDMDW